VSGPEPRRFLQPGGAHNATPPRIVFGSGSVSGLPAEVHRLGATRALVVTTPGRAALGRQLQDLIGGAAIGVLAEAVSQVPIELAERSREQARDLDADCLIAVGGGAATGLCKGIALEHPLPIIAIPTTYSGSEMTAFCGITIAGVKRMHRSRNMLAATVVYDPELSVSLPAAVTASSTMNALAHCIDGIWQPTLSPLVAHAAAEGVQVLVGALPKVLADPRDLFGRTELLYGAHLAGGVLAGGFTLQHAIAHTLGGSFGIEHGLAHSLVLPHVTRHLQSVIPDLMAPIAATLGTDDIAAVVADLARTSGLPSSLLEVGLTAADVERAVDITMSTEPNPDEPVPVTADVVRAILEAALCGELAEVGR